MDSFRYRYLETGDGARIRYGYWLPNNPGHGSEEPLTVLILQGRASFMEKFKGVIEGLRQRNLHIWAFDWRGQGLSSRHLKDPHKGHIVSYDTYLQDLEHLMREKILPTLRGPLVILAQSMGAHLALRYMRKNPEMASMAVLVAPMLDLNTGAYSKKVARGMVALLNHLGFHESYVFGYGAYDPKKEPFEGNFLTHDRETFFEHRKLQIDNPHLSLGGATFGWLHATFDSIHQVNRPEFLAHIQTPILMITAGKEVVVDNTSLPKICQHLPACQLVTYLKAKHQILMESEDILKQFWKDFDLFIQENLPKAQAACLAKRRLVESAQLPGMKRLYPTLPNYLNGFQPNG